MKNVVVRLVILSLAEVAMVDELLPARHVDNRGVLAACAELILDSRITNHGKAKLVCVSDTPEGHVEIVYRIRTESRQLNPEMHWEHVDKSKFESVHRLVNRALDSERP